MGTTSTIKFISKRDSGEYPLVNIYQQYDGYIEGGVGHDLARWLMNITLINGIGVYQYNKKYCNGTGCLAAQYIATRKERPGDLYIEDMEYTADYNYKVVINEFYNVPPDGIPLDYICTVEDTDSHGDEILPPMPPSHMLNRY